MKYKTYLSLGLLAAVVAWMLTGVMANAPESNVPGAEMTASADIPAEAMMKVTVMEVEASEVTREIVIQGELEPRRQVEIRSQTASQVAALPVNKGDKVKADTLLIKLKAEDRFAILNRAKAAVKNHQLETEGIRKLQKKGLQAETRLKAAEASLASAQADLEHALLEIEHLSVTAPFNGVLEERYIELGSHVTNGEKLALLVDESIMKAVGQVSQQSAGQLRLGQTIKLKLLDGQEAEGRVTYISSVGDAETHSFRIEAQVPNEDGQLSAGVSAELRIAIGQALAHFVSPSVLSLDEKGEVGVKGIDMNNQVEFFPIELVRTEANGVWVSGLPQKARIITLGQGFVSAGETVIPSMLPDADLHKLNLNTTNTNISATHTPDISAPGI